MAAKIIIKKSTGTWIELKNISERFTSLKSSNYTFSHSFSKQTYKPDPVPLLRKVIIISLVRMLPHESLRFSPIARDTTLHSSKDLAVAPPTLP